MTNILNKKISIDKIAESLPYVFFISILFESICFFMVGTFPVTVTFVFSLLLLITQFIYSLRRNTGIKQIIIGFAIVALMIVSSVFSKEEIQYTSLLLYLYFGLFYIFVNPKLEDEKIKKTCKIFVIIVTICSLYGIYQFGVNNLNLSLPFKELIPTSLLTPNYNTFGKAYIGSYVLYRAHSIFLEASHFSQLASVAILLTFYVINYKQNKLWFWLILIINALGIVTSLAGSGFIILIAGLIFLLIKNWKVKFVISSKVFVILGGLIIIAFVVLIKLGIFEKLIQYYIKRTSEVDSDVKGSGYYRFVVPLLALFYTITYKFLGFGAGNDAIAAHILGSPEDFIPNGFGKITAESGILGLILYFEVVFGLMPKKEEKDLMKMLFIIFLMYSFCGGAFTQTSFWCYAILLKGCKEQSSLIQESVL